MIHTNVQEYKIKCGRTYEIKCTINYENELLLKNNLYTQLFYHTADNIDNRGSTFLQCFLAILQLSRIQPCLNQLLYLVFPNTWCRFTYLLFHSW